MRICLLDPIRILHDKYWFFFSTNWKRHPLQWWVHLITTVDVFIALATNDLYNTWLSNTAVSETDPSCQNLSMMVSPMATYGTHINILIFLWFVCMHTTRFRDNLWVQGMFHYICWDPQRSFFHYSDAKMKALASQIICVSIVCSTDGSESDQRKHQRSAGMFPFGDVIAWDREFVDSVPVVADLQYNLFLKLNDVSASLMRSRRLISNTNDTTEWCMLLISMKVIYHGNSLGELKNTWNTLQNAKLVFIKITWCNYIGVAKFHWDSLP